MQAVLKAQINKTDRNDARGIAQMMRVGLYRPVHVKTLRSQKLRMLLTPGCVKTLRGITAPGILGSTVMRRAKKRKNLSSARHYDQIRFRFHTTKTHFGHSQFAAKGRRPRLLESSGSNTAQ
jgi:hypothetical protein